MTLLRLAPVAALLAAPLALAQSSSPASYQSEAEQTIRYEVGPVGDSNLRGSVLIAGFPGSEGAIVTVLLAGTSADGEHPAHFHIGDCGSNGDIVVPLESVDGATGMSVTRTDASFESIVSGDHYLNVHLSTNDLGTIVACGEAGQGAAEFSGLAEAGDSSERDMGDDGEGAAAQQEGVAAPATPVRPEEFETLRTASFNIYPTEFSEVTGTVQVTERQGAGARVTITIQNVPSADYSFPAHFHDGDCGSGGGIVVPLQSVPTPGLENSSVTDTDASFDEIMEQDLYINLHASAQDIGTIIACGEVGVGADQ